MLLKVAEAGEKPVKDRLVYTNLAQTLMLSQLKPSGYELIKLPYDYYCPSVQDKLKQSGGERYQCVLSRCRKRFTTLELANKHSMLSGHTDLHLQDQHHDSITIRDVPKDEDEIDKALIIPPGKIPAFLRSQFEDEVE